LANIDQFVEEIPISDPSQIDDPDAAAPNLEEAEIWFSEYDPGPSDVIIVFNLFCCC
jgi:hypothetical protein